MESAGERIGRCLLVGLDDLPADLGEPSAVVVIDVIRAFTTAVAVFEAGAAEIRCVAGLDEARALATSLPGSLLIGEERGVAPAGFDAGNSPIDLGGHDWVGRTVVQRTSNGTRGLARFAGAAVVLAAAAANVGATAAWVRDNTVGAVLVVGTGSTTGDLDCGRRLAELIAGGAPDQGELGAAVTAAADQHRGFWSRRRSGGEVAAFLADIDACARVDSSAMVLVGHAVDGAVVLRPWVS